MSGYVVDASVAVKWFVHEPFTGEARRLLKSTHTLAAPELLFAEVTNVLWAMRRRGDIGESDFAEAAGALKSAPVVIPTPMPELVPVAGRLAADLEHPAYDCFYLALGLHEQYSVVTADRRFYGKVREHPYLSDRIIHIENLKGD